MGHAGPLCCMGLLGSDHSPINGLWAVCSFCSDVGVSNPHAIRSWSCLGSLTTPCLTVQSADSSSQGAADLLTDFDVCRATSERGRVARTWTGIPLKYEDEDEEEFELRSVRFTGQTTWTYLSCLCNKISIIPRSYIGGRGNSLQEAIYSILGWVPHEFSYRHEHECTKIIRHI